MVGLGVFGDSLASFDLANQQVIFFDSTLRPVGFWPTAAAGFLGAADLALSPERVFIIEDTGEIQCAAENFVQYHTSLEVTMTMLLKTTLRMRPDRILVGEVRGPEALDLLMAWNTGHEGGAATLHANNARSGLDRLAMLISMHPESPRPIEPLIGEAVHVIVHIARTPEGRCVQEILEVAGYADGAYLTRVL
jgi:type IV secretion system protein VirB11